MDSNGGIDADRAAVLEILARRPALFTDELRAELAMTSAQLEATLDSLGNQVVRITRNSSDPHIGTRFTVVALAAPPGGSTAAIARATTYWDTFERQLAGQHRCG